MRVSSCYLLSTVSMVLLSGCVSSSPRLTATDFLHDSGSCEQQTHQIGGEPEYQRCMARLGWPDPRSQLAGIQPEDQTDSGNNGMIDDAINGLRFGLEWDISPD